MRLKNYNPIDICIIQSIRQLKSFEYYSKSSLTSILCQDQGYWRLFLLFLFLHKNSLSH